MPAGLSFEGVYPILVTPFDEREEVDHESFARVVQFMDKVKKLATAEEVANACVFLLSDLSGSTTGASLRVDGGWTAA